MTEEAMYGVRRFFYLGPTLERLIRYPLESFVSALQNALPMQAPREQAHLVKTVTLTMSF